MSLSEIRRISGTKNWEAQRLSEKDYKVFAGTADILVYFYELGLRRSKTERQVFVYYFKQFMRASYGVSLRNFLGNYQSR
jgi:hypothetical protein